jgi:hypothetical protein
MSDTDRRALLRGGLKAALAGAGGLLLPWQGGGAFALPDLGKAALVPSPTARSPCRPKLSNCDASWRVSTRST